MNHPKGYVGEVSFNHPLGVTHPVLKLQRAHFGGYVGFRFEKSLLETDGILNCYLRLEPLHGSTRNLRAAVKSARRLHFRDAFRAAWRR